MLPDWRQHGAVVAWFDPALPLRLYLRPVNAHWVTLGPCMAIGASVGAYGAEHAYFRYVRTFNEILNHMGQRHRRLV